MTVEKNLLDTLAEGVGCQCLSQLREPLYRSLLLRKLKALPARAYSIAMWKDAAEYLLGRPAREIYMEEPTTQEQIKKWLLDCLKDKKRWL